MRYSLAVKQARLRATAEFIQGSSLVLLTEGRRELASIGISLVTVETDELQVAVPLEARATGRGRAVTAEIRHPVTGLVADELAIGKDVLLDNDSLVEGQTVRVLDARIRHG
ncbi:MAG TPA: hypothetical protein VLH36_07435 [Steroidobacteraceae bacterium]|nr:hypothetical protein [Steroidobacteraceae bacterium]